MTIQQLGAGARKLFTETLDSEYLDYRGSPDYIKSGLAAWGNMVVGGLEALNCLANLAGLGVLFGVPTLFLAAKGFQQAIVERNGKYFGTAAMLALSGGLACIPVVGAIGNGALALVDGAQFLFHRSDHS